MRRTALTLAFALFAAPAAAQTDELLDFDWLTDDQRARVEAAHEALDAATRDMCAVMIDLYVQHAALVHGDAPLGTEAMSFFNRRCRVEAHADHLRHSIALHDLVHAEMHASHGDHGHDDHAEGDDHQE